MNSHFKSSFLKAAMTLAATLTCSGMMALPQYIDNSKSIYFPPIISQKGGSCAQASGIGYMFTYEINRLLNRNASASADNQFAYLFTWNMVNDGADNGGFVDEGLNIARNFGVMTAADYGYASVYQFKWASGYEKYLNAARYRVKKIKSFDDSNDAGIQEIKQYLYDHGDGSLTGGVLTFSTQASDWQINYNYTGPSLTGYTSILTKLATEGAHAITIAGYDDTVESTDDNGNKHLGAFIVVNSWGTWWADNGRFYMPYYFFTERSSQSESFLSTEMQGCDVYVHEPRIMFKVHLDYSSRNDLRVTYGAATSEYARSADNNYNSIIMFNQGGDHPMTGAFSASKSGDIEFGIDFTDHITSASQQYGRYFLNVMRSNRGKELGSGKIEYVSVFDYRGDKPVEYVCRNISGKELQLGANRFIIPTGHPGHFSASSVSPLNIDGSVKSDKVFVVRTANGHYAKLRFSGTHDNMNMNYTILQ